MELKVQNVSQDVKHLDLTVVGVFHGAKPSVSTVFRRDFKAQVEKILVSKEFKGSAGEGLLLQVLDQLVYAVGLGSKKTFNDEKVRKAGAALRAFGHSGRHANIVVDLASFNYALSPLVEGILLSDYKFDKYKSKKAPKPRIKKISLVTEGKRLKACEKALNETKLICQAVATARDLGNEPANELYPDSYAKRIAKLFTKTTVKCQVFDEKKLSQMRMGGIIAVGKGSQRPPRLVRMEYKPSRCRNKKPVILVGKGVTFDTGGISIKPSPAMDEMKFDMCGSAAVVGAMQAIAALKLPVHVIGLTPLAENMPGGKAQRPGDVIECYNGKTVEVLNTDAEGRLILADAISYADTLNPKCIVDIATLTGACAYVLDYAGSGVMSNKDDLAGKLVKSGTKAGEKLCHFPLWEEYDSFIKGKVADIQNISNRKAGIQTAGIFLRHFAGKSDWAHLDIAGSAWNSLYSYHPKGATGVGVRLFVEFVRTYG